MAYTTPPTFVALNALSAAQLNLLGDDIVYLNSNIPVTLLTTRGDLLYRNLTVPARLGIGANGTFLKSNGTDPAWAALAASDIASGAFAEARGGTNQSTYALGDLLYSSASNTLAKLAGNITTTRKFLRQVGNGSVSAAPVWDTVLGTDLVHIGARVYNSANIACANATVTALTFDTERYDSDSIHSTVSNTSRLVAPLAGRYLITGMMRYAAAANNTRYAQIRLNGTTFIASNSLIAAVSDNHDLSVATIYQLAAGDYVELIAYQNSGGSVNVVASGNFSPEFAMHWLGA
jgi:hypothetical protein